MNLLIKYSNIIEEIKNNNNVSAIILFGSYSENNIKPLSDLDICIVFKKNSKKEDKNYILSYGNDELDISAIEDLPLSLQYKILNFGKLLYQNEDISSLKYIITNQWFDFRRIQDRMYKNRGYKGLEI